MREPLQQSKQFLGPPDLAALESAGCPVAQDFGKQGNLFLDLGRLYDGRASSQVFLLQQQGAVRHVCGFSVLFLAFQFVRLVFVVWVDLTFNIGKHFERSEVVTSY